MAMWLDEVKEIMCSPVDPFWELERAYLARPRPRIGAGTHAYRGRRG